MRPTMSILSPAPFVGPLRNVSRESTVGRHVQPPPAKKPLWCCHVRPRSICSGDFASYVNPAGANEPSSPSSCVLVFSSDFVYASPLSSAVKRSALREGNPAPTPQRNPFVVSVSSGVPRKMKPAKPETSTRSFSSLLTTPSNVKSTLPVLAPLSLSPVGSLSRSRSALDIFRSRADVRFHLAPSVRSPM